MIFIMIKTTFYSLGLESKRCHFTYTGDNDSGRDSDSGNKRDSGRDSDHDCDEDEYQGAK